ncbi:MAG: sugar phosphate isomerase/epimerase [Bacteroidota bacterium]
MRYLSTLLLLFAIACTSTQPESSEIPQEETKMEESYGGLALYTLRDTMAKDPKGVLKIVADMGYEYIEAAGYSDGKFYGMAPAEFKSYLAQIGLKPMSSHHGRVSLDNADQMIADAKAAGFTYFVIPIPPMGHFKVDENGLGMSEELEEITDILSTIGEKCSAAGLVMLYHNHDMEFKENSKGIIPMDYFIENTNPEHVKFQLDLYWAIKAGVDPIAYFEKAPGRFKSWHMKDIDEEGRFAPVGEGSIDFANILKNKELSGMEHFFVEQDQAFEQTPLEAIAISHKAIGDLGMR